MKIGADIITSMIRDILGGRSGSVTNAGMGQPNRRNDGYDEDRIAAARERRRLRRLRNVELVDRGGFRQ